MVYWMRTKRKRTKRKRKKKHEEYKEVEDYSEDDDYLEDDEYSDNEDDDSDSECSCPRCEANRMARTFYSQMIRGSGSLRHTVDSSDMTMNRQKKQSVVLFAWDLKAANTNLPCCRVAEDMIPK